jgi:hypothetical protein
MEEMYIIELPEKVYRDEYFYLTPDIMEFEKNKIEFSSPWYNKKGLCRIIFNSEWHIFPENWLKHKQ